MDRSLAALSHKIMPMMTVYQTPSILMSLVLLIDQLV